MPPQIVDVSGFTYSIPDVVLLDASFAMKAISIPGSPSTRSLRSASAFIQQLSKSYFSNNCMAFICLASLEECYFIILKKLIEADRDLDALRRSIASSKHTSLHRVTAIQLYKEDASILGKYSQHLVTFREALEAIPVLIVGPEDFGPPQHPGDSLVAVMEHHIESTYLMPADALLAASAEALGILNIATADRDFRRLGPDFTLYII